MVFAAAEAAAGTDMDLREAVSIPNRGLWFLRRTPIHFGYLGRYLMFQSLIGVYGFCGKYTLPCDGTYTLFQSLIGVYGFCGALHRIIRRILKCFNP